jgi:hypothetical protein
VEEEEVINMYQCADYLDYLITTHILHRTPTSPHTHAHSCTLVGGLFPASGIVCEFVVDLLSPGVVALPVHCDRR